jgi:DNA ligase-1
MIKLIKELESNGSTLKKAELLSEFKDKDLLKEVLFYTLNPYYNYYIKKLPKMQTGTKNFEKGWEWVKALLDDLNARLTTGNAAIETTIAVLESLNPEAQELAKRILFRDLRCNVSDKIVNKVFPDLIPTFSVQLANKYEPDKKYKNQMWAASRKMDGLRCAFVNGKLYTRNGKEVFGFDHIIDELKELDKLGPFTFVDGELYSHDIPFQTIQSYVTTKKNINEEDKKKIFYNIFAVLVPKENDTITMVGFIEETRRTNKVLGNFKYLEFVKYELINNDFEKIKKLNEQYVSEGYEGVMLRSVDIAYDWKRSDALLKYKSFKEEDLTIVAYVEGKGKYQGMFGKFMCEGFVEGCDVLVECGSGFTDEQRVEIWKDREKMIGKTIEVKYQSLTDERTSLRFPIFLKFKEDR